ncbi:glycosyltransferase family 52 [Otariodibacter oris]|uniref:Beta-galactosamide-alpha-2,3-sialyltransferase n=1 Tax=Otariodibacter oris TaxID=1032623 RepID=A0A420XHM3_9PAST|nr:glycosyltransferase family 52 [Otariodibacter oris]QGM81064.1 CMP-N-acetylneuraminate-beta-galactosamide-alpha-2, 3-sialyltransferase [Otariodibacter oris]RKR76749.1 beta-galactosamide-alpha-2,3-sialyltransferase [Otariodibacter oris]
MNIIICYTPLHVLIAERIIELYPNEKFYGVMIYPVDNEKYQHYSEKLQAKCNQFFSLHQHTDRFNLLKEIIELKYRFYRKNFQRVFVASINDIQIQFLLSSISFQHFYTFDDGTANIVPSSVYYKDEPKTFIRRTINRVLHNKYSVEILKSLSEAHYTIYPDFPNIISNTINIDLFSSLSSSSNVESVSILLGQPAFLENEKNIKLAESVIKKFNIQYYFPHPREQYQLSQVEYIDTPLILEDYLSQVVKNKKCKIYTYFSSAVLNVYHNENIEVTSLRIDTDEPAFIESYELLKKVGINIIDIRE